ncbi:hypothetical protein [Amycolatopsis sp. CA-230715]|uniref:hypothetical protein n=1 Tax=Amycolatopsis sp. CA-230715 TaxID=2745196 RepID=UPI001C00B561|nr:hypothetical protein [Amycolatopsis sp. CA-230715]
MRKDMGATSRQVFGARSTAIPVETSCTSDAFVEAGHALVTKTGHEWIALVRKEKPL